MAMLAQISLGVTDPDRAAGFWSRALHYDRRPPRWDGDDWIVLEPPSGLPGAPIAPDVSGSPAEDFPRIHLDLDAGDTPLKTEVARLVTLGARHVDRPFCPAPGERHPDEVPYVVLADPEGNRFCVGGTR